MRPTKTSGFSLVEAMIAIVLLGIVVTKLTIVIDQARDSYGQESARMAIEDRALYVLDQVAYAVMSADRDSLLPDPSLPTFTSRLQFQVSMGVEDGEIVLGDPEVIALTDEGSSLYWAQNEGEENERLVTWANNVSELLGEELLNGADDNGNGLLDESGLNFVIDRNSVTIRLTLAGEDSRGKPIRHTVQTTVTCRN